MKKEVKRKERVYIILPIIIVGLFIILVGSFFKSYAALDPIKSISFSSEKLNYDNREPGSVGITKSAEWVRNGQAKIMLNVDTIVKEKKENKDVLLILDVSESMIDSKLSQIKKDTKELVSSLLSNQNNSVAIITFENTSSILLDFTSDQDAVFLQIDSLYAKGGTNYYQALINADHLLKDYVPKEDTECLILFLTDGYPNIDVPNEEGQYRYLKEKYPFLTIHGIQYEMGKDILQPIVNISDDQYIADMNTLNNILFEASTIADVYTDMTVTDWIDNDYFEIASISDIQSSFGTVNLVYEEEVPKIIWNLNDLKTGSNATLEIDIQLKNKYYDSNSIVPTNKKEELSYEIDGQKESIVSDKTPRLSVQYQISYDENLPTGCNINNIPIPEYYMAYSIVDFSDKKLMCDGYQFKGWVPITDNTVKQGEYSLIMPNSDVILRAEWSKVSINKSMNGEVYVAPPPILQQILWTYNNELWQYRSSITKIVIQDTITSVLNEKENWDISKEKNGSVIGRLAVNTNDPTTYTAYIQGEGKVIANPNSSNLFKNFTQLETIEGLEHFDTTNVISMSYMFRGNEKLTSLDLSHFDTSKVTDMSSMLYSCKELTSLDLSHFDTKNVTNMANMFAYCEKLTTLDVSHFNTSKVRDMQLMFSWTINLTSLNLNNFNTQNVTNMTNMFSGCNSLTSLDLSSFNTEKVTSMRNMFYECYNLLSLDISSFTTSNVTSMYAMFQACNVLPIINVSHFDTINVTDMSHMFYGCAEVTSLDVSHFNTSKVTDMSYMFHTCYKLTSLDLKSFNTSKVTDMQYMFNGCINLTALDLSSFNTSQVTDMTAMFAGDFYLSSINVSSFNTQNVTKMSYMFYDCQRITSLNLAGFDTTKVVNIDHFFDRCTILTTTITIRFSSGTYASMFETAAIYGGKITVNYTSAASSFVDTLLTTKSSNSNVVKGSLVS